MEIEQAKAFVARMKTDSEFRDQVLNNKDHQSRKSFLAENDFDFFGLSAEDSRELFAETDENELVRLIEVSHTDAGCVWSVKNE